MCGPAVIPSSLPFTSERIHAAAVYCSDGRLGTHCDQFLQQDLGLPRYDRLAVPGGPACFAGHLEIHSEEDGVEAQLAFLAEAHGLERIILIGHENCAFYLMRLGIDPKELRPHQFEDLDKAVARVRELAPNLRIEAWFAAIDGDRVSFEPVIIP